MIVKSPAYLLRPDGLDTSRELYRRVMDQFPVLTREAMLKQLQRLRMRRAGDRQYPEHRRILKRDIDMNDRRSGSEFPASGGSFRGKE